MYQDYTFIYQGKHSITFYMDANLRVNATEMGKIFGKLPKDFLMLKSTKEFIRELYIKNICEKVENLSVKYSNLKENSPQDLKDVQKILKIFPNYNEMLEKLNDIENVTSKDFPSEIVKVMPNQTVFNRTLAVEFAGWLSVRFKVWTTSVIEELMFGEMDELRKAHETDAKAELRITELEQELSEEGYEKAIELLNLYNVRKGATKVKKQVHARLKKDAKLKFKL